MAENDFLSFAGDPAADVMLQTDYAATGFTPRILGFGTGTAVSTQLNKVWRQASLMAAMVAQFTCDETGANMIDDGSSAGQATLLANFKNAVHIASGAGLAGNYLPLIGGALTGQLSITSIGPQLAIQATTSQNAVVTIARNPGMVAQITAYSNTLARWLVNLADSVPETGGNVGSNFNISRFNDAGTYLDTPFQISRATGQVNFSQNPLVNGGNLPYVPLAGGRMTGYMGSPGINYSYGGYGHNFSFYWDGNWVFAVVDNSAVEQLATVPWVQSVAGAYLPIGGGTITGNLQVNGAFTCYSNGGFYGSLWFAGVSDFVNFWDGTNRFRQWAGGWYDYWRGTDGMRVWQCYGGPNMTLDGGANLGVSGSMTSNAGRLRAISGGQSSVSAWGSGYGLCVGFWVSNDGMWLGGMDANGNPNAAWARVGNDGSFLVPGNYIQSGSFIQANGRFIGLDRLVIHSGYPGLVMDCNNQGVAGILRTDGGGLHFGQCDANGDNANGLMTLNWSGWFYVSGGVGSPSDISLKSRIQDSAGFDSLAAVQRLRSVSFDWKMTKEHQPFGFLAEEVRQVLPDVVRTNEDDGLEYLDITALLVHALRAIKQLGDRP